MMLEDEVRTDLFANADREIFTKVRNSAPTKYDSSAKISNSMIADGCTIEGEVENSIIFRGVHVAGSRPHRARGVRQLGLFGVVAVRDHGV